MTAPDPNDLTSSIAPHLPLLRRFARALTGTQRSGDDYAAATLEAILADRSVFDTSRGARVALYGVFHAIWSSSGAHVDEPDPDEGDLAITAQRRLCDLMPGTRVALLLSSLEGFGPDDIAAIMGVPQAEAEELVQIGNREIRRQVSGRVLIIEDEPIIAMDLEAIVAGLGHTVVGTADTRDTAVAAAHAKKPNLILADIQLADGSSGIDAVSQILSSFTVPVIFITAYPERLLTGERPEPTFLITKPFTEDQVSAAVGQALFFQTIVDPA